MAKLYYHALISFHIQETEDDTSIMAVDAESPMESSATINDKIIGTNFLCWILHGGYGELCQHNFENNTLQYVYISILRIP